MKKIFISGLLLVSTLSLAQTKQQKIEELMNITGSASLGITAMNDFVVYFKEAYPSVPDEFWEEFLKEVKPDDLTKMIVPIYDKYFTDKEIDDFLAFYKSPSGKKFAEKTPLIYKDSQEAGVKWGEQLAMKIVQKMESKNYGTPPPPKQHK